jgi:hypothetical protein
VVAATVAAYSAFVLTLGHGPATSSVFAILGLTAAPSSSRRYFTKQAFDEREREISRKAVRAGFSAFWVVFTGGILATGFVKGWDATLQIPAWGLLEVLCWASVLILGVQAATTLALYRGEYRA